jgi:hypothetical protein
LWLRNGCSTRDPTNCKTLNRSLTPHIWCRFLQGWPHYHKPHPDWRPISRVSGLYWRFDSTACPGSAPLITWLGSSSSMGGSAGGFPGSLASREGGNQGNILLPQGEAWLVQYNSVRILLRPWCHAVLMGEISQRGNFVAAMW